MNIRLLPYTPDNPTIKSTFLRLLVEPIPKPAYTTDAGLIVPGDVGALCETGIVRATCEGSKIKEGDKILYKKVERNTAEHLDTISIEGKKYDVLYENEVWAVNEHPWNRVFVQDLSEMQVNESGLIVPEQVKGITAKGIVFRAPDDYSVKGGDDIEYRKQERNIYPSIEIEGQRYLVLHEADIFIVNGRVAPYRIIVKIDIAAQKIKRTTTESGLVRSPLFTFMLFNMQVGEVVEIGREARKNFPELKIGDQAILHHRVESEQYRLIKQDFAKADGNVVTYEYRILDGFSPEHRDVFGRVVNRKKGMFAAFGKSVFLDWNFELLDKNSESNSSLLLDFDTNIDKCTNIEDLKSTIDHKQQDGFAKAVAKRKGILGALSKLQLPQDKEKYDRLESELRLSEKESVRIGNYINGNHLLVCKRLGSNEKVVLGYKEIYPINVLGFKFLIGYEDFVQAEINLVAETAHSD